MEIIKAIIFDFDGVLYDSEPNHLKACNSVFEPMGFTIPYNVYVKKYMGLSDPEMFPIIFSDYGLLCNGDEIKGYINQKIEAYKNILQNDENLPGVYGVKDFLVEISKFIKKFAICSGSSRQELEAALVKLEQGSIKKYFPIITTIEDVSDGKPSPEGYLKTAKKLNIAENQCLVIEDTPKGITAAKEAGMKVVALTTSYPREELKIADFVADSYTNAFNWAKEQFININQVCAE